MKKKQKLLTKKDGPASLAVTSGSAIAFPKCGSGAWVRQEIERMLDNDRHDREQLDELIRTAPPALPADMAALEKLGNPFLPNTSGRPRHE